MVNVNAGSNVPLKVWNSLYRTLVEIYPSGFPRTSAPNYLIDHQFLHRFNAE
jgi:hypothetical protein